MAHILSPETFPRSKTTSCGVPLGKWSVIDRVEFHMVTEKTDIQHDYHNVDIYTYLHLCRVDSYRSHKVASHDRSSRG